MAYKKNRENGLSAKCVVSANDIYTLLKAKFSDDRQWLCAREVADTTGFGNRRLDFVAVNCYESKGFGIHAFEVKVSKYDLRRELEDPSKHNIFFDWVDTYSICAPDFVLDAEYKEMIPPKWGIYTLSTRIVKGGVEECEQYLKTVRKPIPLHDEKDITIKRSFAMSLLRAIKNQNAETAAIQELLKAEYERGKSDGMANANQGNIQIKRMSDDEKWKSRFCDALNIRSAERAEECIHKVNAMVAIYNEMGWLNNRVADIEQAIVTVKRFSSEFLTLMAKDRNGERA